MRSKKLRILLLILNLVTWNTRAFNEVLLNFCNSVYNKEQIKSWTEGCILPVVSYS